MAILKHIKIAQDLASIRSKITDIKESLLTPLEEKETELEIELLNALKAQGLQNIKLENVGVFTRAFRTSVKITDMDKAFEWANKQLDDGIAIFKIDTTLASKMIKPLLETPAGFELAETEYLSVRKAEEE